ncbi:hypothetical protein Mp_7g09720 [Marchantia polymorpha subsp. ruderalis]|uniref:E2 ubiquitin-conjugating enzyme n=2 Tax=Marchantia polymorpha TaxID=3197 RepID=A0AAF6BXV5_MARPO|nr:hypothetical protein MARPO_0156s0011 [Marchantia polymorpha]BBN16839.1 hypothetical protein Mp_7g09720 [Marchantia polymorpha subsp. ruderalis]|eukprot:PTQ28710.1 hypothetical protein MARPO_0156s0011 [Marchantia polymorpha]
MEGVVVDVEAGSVLVYWIAAGNALSNSHSSSVPNEEQDAKKLLPMIYFSHTNWQLGDRSLPPVRMRPKSVVPLEPTTDVIPSDGEAESSVENNAARSPETVDVVCGSAEGCKDAWGTHRRKSKQRRPIKRDKKVQKKEKPVEYAVLVVNTRTTVDIVWQDGTVSQGLDACSLIPVDHLGDHDFWPEQYVMERGADGEGLDVDPRRVGIVKSVDAKQRTATVRWLKIVQRPEEPREFESEEVVSVYELVEHPDYSYCLGDVVIRLTPSPMASDETPFMDESDAAVSSGVEETSEVDADENEACTSRSSSDKLLKQSAKRKGRSSKVVNQDLSWVGVITGLQDGDIEVAWADGMVSKVGPQAILVVNRDLEDSSSAHTSDLEDAEDVDDAASWETVLSDDELTRIEQEEEAWTDKERPAWDDEVAESQDNGQGNEAVELLADAGGKDLATDERGQVENRPQKYGGPFKLPLVAFGLVSRFAAGWWGQRGSKKGADSAGVARASSSQGRVKHGLEEILDEEISAGSEEQVPQSPKRRVVERVAPCKRDALRMFNDTVLNPVDREDQELDMAASNTATDADSEDRNSSAFADSFTTLEDEQTQSLADVINAVNSSPDGDDFVKAESNSEKIKHFDSVKDPADHHYVGETAQPTNNRKWVKKIQQEWSILEKNLPDTIYVRVYEDRMDLIRAVIVGAAGTPYHDGLFVFDLYLPPEYPSVPPVAHYHSGGLRLNPNLYENGKVCLSLLNTWTGKGSEIWHPSTSSILQLLVSIQGLVLNAKPYFNEAGYDRQVGTGEGEKNSVVYNENSFLLSCKSMLYLLRRPPRHFEELIGEHFRQRGNRIIQSCKAYLAGAEVGSLIESDLECAAESYSEDKSSAGFKLMLKKLVPKLTAALLEVGASIDAVFMNSINA